MPRPIFIIGSPRSGTSVLTWAIGQHPNIAVQPETNWMPTMAHAAFDAYQIGTSRGDFTQLSWAQMSFEAFAAHFGKTIDEISRECFERNVEIHYPGYRQGSDGPDDDVGFRLIRSPTEPKQRWVDGTPAYSFSTYALSLLFPDCLFIHILRRPDQVVNSLAHFENLGMDDTHSFELPKALRVWTRHTEASREAADYFGKERVLRVDHADLLANGASVLSRCFSFIGEPDCDRAAAALGSKMNSSMASEKQRETTDKIASWPEFKAAQKLYEDLRDEDIPEQPSDEALAEQRRQFTPIGQTEKRHDDFLRQIRDEHVHLLKRLFRRYMHSRARRIASRSTSPWAKEKS